MVYPLRRTFRVLALLAVGALFFGPAARGQGFIVDRHGDRPIARSYEVKEVSLDARVRDQVAEVQVSQTFHNPGSFPIDAEFLFPLPEEGAVQNFVLLVDGQELPGKLMAKDEARRIYEEIVRTRRDPALLEYMGRGLYRTSVFPIPPGADRKVTMRFTQLCKRDRDLVEFAYPLSTQKYTAKPVQRLALTLRIETRDALKSIYSPSHDARIERRGDHEAVVKIEQRDVVPTTDFRLVASLAEGAVGTSVLSYRPSSGEDGYFLLLASPEIKVETARRLPKTVVFVLDRSGSMAGKKIEQARKALRFVLDNLRDDDLFNIVVYDDRVDTFKPELQRYDRSTREEAVRFVDNIREGGSTNIDAALAEAMAQIRNDDRPGYILFLTDGLPTAGEINEAAIAEHARSANKQRARLFVFGVGYDVNARLLDRLSGANSGTSEYVKPDEDIETHVAKFYSRMTSPVLASLRLEFDGTDVNRVYPRDIPDLFEGGQLVVAGRYTRPGSARVRLSGKVGGERRTYEFPVDLASSDQGRRHDYVETLWATRRVGDLIDQIDLKGRNQELINELVALSTRYGLLTPYTSFLADDRVPLHATRDNFGRAQLSLRQLDEVSGAGGVAQREMKQQYRLADRAMPAESDTLAAVPAAKSAAGLPGMTGRGPAAPLAPGAVSAPAGGQMMGGGYGFGAGMAGMRGAPTIAQPEAGKSLAANVKQIGSKTFFRKGNRWVDSSVKPEEDEKARVIVQFSDAYFALAREQSAELNRYLAFTEPVTVRLGDQVIRIEQAPR